MDTRDIIQYASYHLINDSIRWLSPQDMQVVPLICEWSFTFMRVFSNGFWSNHGQICGFSTVLRAKMNVTRLMSNEYATYSRIRALSLDMRVII